MPTLTTYGVTISLYVSYLPELSQPLANDYKFRYRVHIENHNDFAVRLLRRDWEFFDSQLDIRRNSCYRSSGGFGLTGDQQPVIDAQATLEHTGIVEQCSDLGALHGSFLMEHLDSGDLVEVAIPRVQLTRPCRAN